MQQITSTPRGYTIRLTELIGAAYPRTLCGFSLPASRRAGKGQPVAVRIDDQAVPFQWDAETETLYLQVALPSGGETTIDITLGDTPPAAQPSARVLPTPDGTIVHTSTGALRLPPLGTVTYEAGGADSFCVPPPIAAVQFADQPWRGRGYLDTRAHLGGYSCTHTASGPLFDRVEVAYQLTDGREAFRFTCTVVRDEPWARIGETASFGPKARWWLAFGAEWLPDHTTLLDHTLAYTDRRLAYYKDICEARLYYWTQGSQIADLREGLGLYREGAPEYLGWFAMCGNDWDGAKTNFVEFWQRRMRPDTPLSKGEESWAANWDWFPETGGIPAQGHSANAPVFTVESLLVSGSKHYGLLIGDRAAYTYAGPIPIHDLEWYVGPVKLEEWAQLRSPLRSLSIQQGLLPLDMVKDWQFSVDEGLTATPVAIDRRHLLFEEKLAADERAEELGERVPEILERMRTYLTNQAAGYLICRGPGSTNPVTLRRVAPYVFLYRDLLRAGQVPAEMRPQLTALFAFLGHLTSEPFFYPSRASMAPYHSDASTEPTFMGMCNQNFLTDVYSTHGAIGLVLPGHPRASEWVARFDALLERQLDFYMYPTSGVWEESHTYFSHVLYTLLPVLFEEAACGRRNWFADQRFAALSGALLHTLTPPDPNFGARVVAPLGDHGASAGSATPNILACGFAETNPTLAGHLAWWAQENGYKGTLAATPVRPHFTSEVLDGLAAIFRHQDTHGESMVILRVGASWGHHNNDELSLHFYCAGEPVLVEAGYGKPGVFSKEGTSGHTLMAPVDFAPLCYLGKFNRGVVEEFAPEQLPMRMRGARIISMLEGIRRNGNPAVPHDIFPYRQAREVYFFPPNVLLVRDLHDGVYPQQLFWHTGGQAMRAEGNRLQIDGYRHNTEIVTCADVDYTVAADGKTFGARGIVGKTTEVLTVIAVALPGQPRPVILHTPSGVQVNGRTLWP